MPFPKREKQKMKLFEKVFLWIILVLLCGTIWGWWGAAIAACFASLPIILLNDFLLKRIGCSDYSSDEDIKRSRKNISERKSAKKFKSFLETTQLAQEIKSYISNNFDFSIYSNAKVLRDENIENSDIVEKISFYRKVEVSKKKITVLTLDPNDCEYSLRMLDVSFHDLGYTDRGNDNECQALKIYVSEIIESEYRCRYPEAHINNIGETVYLSASIKKENPQYNPNLKRW